MLSHLEQIKDLFASFNNEPIRSIEQLPPSGSDRIYFRLSTAEKSFLATWNLNKKENSTFIAFSEHFRLHGSPVPLVYAVNETGTIYIQEDFGTTSLLDVLEAEGYSDHVYGLYQKSLNELAHIQITGGADLDYERCLTTREFGRQAILSDLLYCKYYFIDTLKYPYDKQALLDDFDALSNYLTHTAYKHFMFRDFQSRNIMIREEAVHFIDYQGGMKGALQYDVASLLWQARAELPDSWKSSLLYHYMDCIDGLLPAPVDRNTFESQYNGYVLIRLLQVLGAYGFRGLFERKAHFLTSIPLALRNLKWFVEHKQTGISLKTLNELLRFMVSDEVISQFEPLHVTEDTPLRVTVNSFSYRDGMPPDAENGGGFVFDCRGILNPGRQEAYKTLTGRDKPVIDYLEQQTRMPDFMNNAFNIVDISVEEYIRRGFSSLMISFGCTGGQHRSVYAADAMARHLRNKFGLRPELKHLIQDAKNWINTP